MTTNDNTDNRTYTHPDVFTIGVRDGWADPETDPTRIVRQQIEKIIPAGIPGISTSPPFMPAGQAPWYSAVSDISWAPLAWA